MIAPTSADPALQVRAIEDLIAKKVDVIGVIPNDGKALVPVLGEAQKSGILVVTQESPDQQNANWDIELTIFRTGGAIICCWRNCTSERAHRFASPCRWW